MQRSKLSVEGEWRHKYNGLYSKDHCFLRFSVASADRVRSVPQPGLKTAPQEQQFTQRNLQTTAVVARRHTLLAKSHCKMDIWNQPGGFPSPGRPTTDYFYPPALFAGFPQLNVQHLEMLSSLPAPPLFFPLLPRPGTTCSDRRADLRSCQVGSRFSA